MQILPPNQAHLTEERLRLAASIRAPLTLYGYASDWRRFSTWCAGCQRPALPASTDTVGLYVTDLLNRGYRITTVSRHVSAIRHHHQAAALASPCNGEIARLLTGARRLLGEHPRGKVPLSVEQLREICRKFSGGDERATLDRAILLFGFATALRRNSIIALNIDDLQFCPEGVLVNVRREKQDQTGRGRVIGVPESRGETCPVRAIQNWLIHRGTAPGALFPAIGPSKTGRVSPGYVASIVKRGVASIGLEPCRFAMHSLRAGMVTAAAEAGCNELVLAQHTGHRSLANLRRYYRPQDAFRANALALTGL